MATDDDVQRVATAAENLPSARGDYRETDVVLNLLATVIGFQTHTTIDGYQ